MTAEAVPTSLDDAVAACRAALWAAIGTAVDTLTSAQGADPVAWRSDATKERIKGKVNEVTGAAKGDTGQELKGKAQKTMGKAQRKIGEIQEDMDRDDR